MDACLYRPVGTKELTLIEASGFKAFPPRLADQPIFYPVTNEDYAVQIARDWNCKFNDDKKGYVTQFFVDENYISRFDRKVVGGRMHEELWVPAEALEEFNRNILGDIKVIRAFAATDDGVVEFSVGELVGGNSDS